MDRKIRSKRPFYFGVPFLLLLLIGVAMSVYFWQMRLQKPVEVNMAHHQHSSGTVSEAGIHDHSSTGVSCETIVAKETSGPIRKFDLTAARTVLQLDNGKTVDAWTFNGTSPGPELRVTEGDRVVVTLRNKDIEEGVTLHWHGINVPCSQDGVWGQLSSNPGSSAPLSSAKEVSAFYQRLESGMLLNGSIKGMNVSGNAGEQVRLRLTNGDNETMNFSIDGAPFRVIVMDGHDLHEPGLLSGTHIPVGAD